MGRDYRPAIFLSARGVKKPVNTKLVSIDELDTIDNLPSSFTNGVMRALLRYDSLEIRASIKGEIEFIHITEMESINNFIRKGEQEFLRKKNESAFLNLCDKINGLKEKVLILSGSESKYNSENIRLLSETIHNYEEFRYEFVEWFFSNHVEVPIIPQQKHSLKSAQEKIIIGNKDDLKVTISSFNTLELIIPKYIEPGIKVAFRLEGKSHQTKLIKLDQVPYSYLMYLAMERNENGKMWMLNPENHTDELHQIYDQLELPISYATEMINELPSRINWFNDHRNKYRKTINSEINAIVRKEGCIKGNLLYNLGKVSPTRNGIYALAKSIQSIK